MNKQRERGTVEAFLAFGGLSDLSMHDWNRERPDAVILRGAEFIGIEVTKLSEAVPRQAIAPQKWWTEANRLVGAAQALFEARNPDALVVRFEMHPTWQPPSRGNSSNLLEDLATIVEHAIADPPRFIRPGEPITLRDPHPDVTWAYIDTTRKDLGGHWQPSFAHDVFRASAADIQCTVARENPDVEGYRRVAPSVWLLIDCDLSGQGISLDIPTPDFKVVTSFDRVFGCGFGMWQWIEIPTTRGQSSTGQANPGMQPTAAVRS